MLKARKVVPEDRAMLDAAAEADPYHRAAGLTGKHWDGAIWYDDEVGPVVALQTTTVVRADIQFLTQDRERNRNALLEGFAAYIGILQKRGVKEVIYSTDSVAVVNFFRRRFKFRHLGGTTYSLRIAP
jgi:hypothetical protein